MEDLLGYAVFGDNDLTLMQLNLEPIKVTFSLTVPFPLTFRACSGQFAHELPRQIPCGVEGVLHGVAIVPNLAAIDLFVRAPIVAAKSSSIVAAVEFDQALVARLSADRCFDIAKFA